MQGPRAGADGCCEVGTQIFCFALGLGMAAALAGLGVGFGLVSLAMAFVARLRRRRGLVLLALALALGAFRGAAWMEQRAQPAADLRTQLRGPPDLWVGELASATWPGPDCRVDARVRADAGRAAQPRRDITRLRVRLRAADCVGARGDAWAFVLDRAPREDRAGRLELPAPAMPISQARAPASRALAERRQRAWAETRGDDRAAFTAAVGLGLRRALRPEVRDAIAAAGLGHLLAISGLHVALVAAALLALLRRLAALRAWPLGVMTLPALLPIFAYVMATGASASACRAGWMAAAWLLASAMGRPRHGRSVLVSVAAGLLMWRPEWLGSPSFQMSVLAIASLEGTRGQALRASWRVTWGLAALSAWHFARVGWIGVVINLLAIPIFATVVLVPSALGWALPPGALARACLACAGAGAQLILDLAQLGARVPEGGEGSWLVLGLVGLSWGWLARRGDPGAAWCRFAPPIWAALGLALVGLLRGQGVGP